MSEGLRFEDLAPPLSARSLRGIHALGFTHMTPVQASTIPYFLKNKDVCVEATTGSGKTLAFALPVFEILHRALRDQGGGEGEEEVEMELARQIHGVFKTFGRFHPAFRCVLLVGGSPVAECVSSFETSGGQILVGTPGRLLDVSTRCPLMCFKKVGFIVIYTIQLWVIYISPNPSPLTPNP
ncbi:P-loop containing nucleoside triphosphate hydrolase protein [Ochromonadaceae sp. CCMP2298]|nr:P-loop containing nucleoside triphosphate hydrolase protein [Ochromonadaceae sp. CCMP2298]